MAGIPGSMIDRPGEGSIPANGCKKRLEEGPVIPILLDQCGPKLNPLGGLFGHLGTWFSSLEIYPVENISCPSDGIARELLRSGVHVR